jgi:hypothetical protein
MDSLLVLYNEIKYQPILGKHKAHHYALIIIHYALRLLFVAYIAIFVKI